MKCTHCKTVNRQDSFYCAQCGVPLVALCPKCYAPRLQEDRYCTRCGSYLPPVSQGIAYSTGKAKAPSSEGLSYTPLTSSTSITSASNCFQNRSFAGQIIPEPERKHVTILFADIAGFTSLSERLDPEEVMMLINHTLQVMTDVVLRYEGFIDKYIGDCLMGIFGAPVSQENHPELAMRAALSMKREVEMLNQQLSLPVDWQVALHVGIHTGLVVAGGIGSDEKRDYTVMGDAVNLAARLESAAGTDQIIVSSATYNLARDLFVFNQLDPIYVKGKQEEIQIFEVTKELGMHSPRTERFLTAPLVGRTHEMNILQQRAEKWIAGDTQAVFVISEPGIGKSRVQCEVKNRYQGNEKVLILEGAGRSFSRSTSYFIFIEIFQGLFYIDSEDTPLSIGKKIIAAFPNLLQIDPELSSLECQEAIAYITQILGGDLSESSHNIRIAFPCDAQEVKIGTFRAIAWFFRRLAILKPVMLILEDLHHADSTSIEVIRYLFESLMDKPVMFLLLMRPVDDHPCERLTLIAHKVLGERATEIAIKRLSNDESDALVKQLLKTEKVPPPILDLVRTRADGNPLFIEEIVRNLVDESVLVHDEDGTLRVVKELQHISVPGSIQGIIMARVDKLPVNLKDLIAIGAVIGPVFKLELLRNVTTFANLEESLENFVNMGIIFESSAFPEVEYSFRNILIQEAIYTTLLQKRRRELHRQVAETIEKIYLNRLEDHVEVLAEHYLVADEPLKAYPYLVKSGLKAKARFANQDASGRFREALRIGKNMKPQPPDLLPLLLAYSETCELLGDMETAIQILKDAHDQVKDEVISADILRNIGRIEEKRGFNAKAFQLYTQAAYTLERYPDRIETGMLYTNQSWVLNRMKQHDAAIEKAQQALTIFEQHNDRDKIAQVYNNLAVIYEHKGELARAKEFNERSLQLFSEDGNKRQMANVYLSLGFLRNKENDLESALVLFEQSLELMDQVGNRFGAGTALMSLGRCYIDLGRFAMAEPTLLRALEIHQDLDMKRKVAANEVALGNLYLHLGRLHEAREHILAGQKVAVEEKFDSDLGRLYQMEAELLIQEGQDPEEKFMQAIDLFYRINRPQDATKIEAQRAAFHSINAKEEG